MTTIFTLEARDRSLGAALVEAREKVRRLNAELKGAAEGTEEYHRLSGEISDTKKRMADLQQKQKELNNELKATKVPTDSLAGLRLEYGKLVTQITGLSKAQRESDFGKQLISQAAAAKSKIDEVEQSVGRFTGNVGNYKSAFQGFLPVITKVGTVFGAVFAALQGGSQVVNVTREFDKLFATLKQATGSETAAKRIFAEIQTFAAETPFQLNEVVGAFIKLENRNFKPTIDQLRTMGDIATSQGKSLDQFVEAILDAQTGEFERLKEFGIVARKQGDDVRVSFRGQTETIANTSESLSKYLLGLGKLPGITGASVAVAKTLDGSLSNMSDNFDRLFATLGASGGILKGLVDGINDIVGAVNDYLTVPLSSQLKDQQQDFNGLVGALIRYNETADDSKASELVRSNIIGELTGKYGEYIGQIDLNNASEMQLRELMDKTNKEFERRIFLQLTQEKSAELFKVVTARANEYAQALKGAAQAEQQLSTEAPVVQPEGGGAPQLNVKAVEQVDRFSFGVALQSKALTESQKAYDDYQREVEDTAKVLFGSLDAFSQYKKKQEDSTTATGEGSKAAKYAADSIKALQERVSKLNEQLQSAPQARIPEILGDLVKAEKDLKAVQDRLEKLRASDQATNTLNALQDRVSKLNEALANAPRDQIPAILGDLAIAEKQLKALEDKIAELRAGGPQAPSLQEIQVQIEGLDQEALQKRIDDLFAGLNPPPIEIPIEAGPSDAELEKIVEFNDTRLSSEEYTTEEINKLRASLTDANLERLRTEAEAEEDKHKRRAEMADEAFQQGIELAEKIASGIAEIETARVEKQKQAALEAAEAEYADRIKKAHGNSKKEALIKADFEKKKEAIEREAAKKRKQIAITEAIIQGALAVIKALPNYVLAAFVAAATAIEVAIMSSADFAAGGFPKEKKRPQVRKMTIGSQAPQTVFDAIPGASVQTSRPTAMVTAAPTVAPIDRLLPPQSIARPLIQVKAQAMPGGSQGLAGVTPGVTPLQPSRSAIRLSQKTGGVQGTVQIPDLLSGGAAVPVGAASSPAQQITYLPDLTAGGYAAPAVASPDRTGRRPAGQIPQAWGTAIVHEGEYISPASQVKRYPHVFAALEQDRIAHAKPYAQGGFPAGQQYASTGFTASPAPVSSLFDSPAKYSTAAPPPLAANLPQAQKTTAEAFFSEAQVATLAQGIAQETAIQVREQIRNGLGEGLQDFDRRLERQAAFEASRTI